MIVRARTCSLLDSRLTFLTNSERLGVLTKLSSMIILTRGDVNVATLCEGSRAGWRGAKIDIHSFRFSDSIGSFGAIGARASCLLDSRLTLLTNLERFNIRVESDAVVVLAWSDFHISTLSERTWSRG